MSMSEAEIAEVVARVVAELRDAEVTPLAVDPTHFQVVSGQVIAADHINSLANQAVPKYPNRAALIADWPAPAVGALAYLQDVNALHVFDSAITGGANTWHVLGGLRMGYGIMGITAANTGQVIPAGALTTLILKSAGGAANKVGRGTWNTDGTVTVPVTGTYLVTGNVTWPSNSTGERRCYVQRFASNVWTLSGVSGGSAESNVPGSSYLRQSVSAMVTCAAGEKVALRVSHSATAALTLVTGTDAPHLGVHLLGGE